jgi:hypothetical protein
MPDDDELERELGRAERLLDPVPAHLLRGALEMFDWRTIDAELAELVFDSVDAHAAVLVRGSDRPRLLTFRAGDLGIELELTGSALTREIVGRLIPAQRAEVEVRYGDRQLTVAADELGRFGGTVPGSGPLSLRCRPAGGTAARQVVTEWIST